MLESVSLHPLKSTHLICDYQQYPFEGLDQVDESSDVGLVGVIELEILNQNLVGLDDVYLLRFRVENEVVVKVEFLQILELAEQLQDFMEKPVVEDHFGDDHV